MPSLASMNMGNTAIFIGDRSTSSATSKWFRRGRLRPGRHHFLRGQHSPCVGATRQRGQLGHDGKLTLWTCTQDPHYLHRRSPKCWGCRRIMSASSPPPTEAASGGKCDPFAHEIIVSKLAMMTGVARSRLPHARGGLRLPSRPASRLMSTKPGSKGWHHHGHAPSHVLGRRSLRRPWRGQHVLHRGAASRRLTKSSATSLKPSECFTNKAPCGPKRGHGTPQPRFAQEIQMDKIAETVELDPG